MGGRNPGDAVEISRDLVVRAEDAFKLEVFAAARGRCRFHPFVDGVRYRRRQRAKVKISRTQGVQLAEKIMLFEVIYPGISQDFELQSLDPGDAFIDMIVRAIREYTGRIGAWLAIIIIHDGKYIRSI
ncbi:hypothetical protein GGE65_000151 [Skermanella aerolata]